MHHPRLSIPAGVGIRVARQMVRRVIGNCELSPTDRVVPYGGASAD